MTLSQSVMPYCTVDVCSTPLEMYATVPTLLARDRTNPAFFGSVLLLALDLWSVYEMHEQFS